MNTAWKISCVVLAILLVGMSALFFVWNGKLNSANAQLNNLNYQVTYLTSQNSTLQTNLTNTQSQLADANSQITNLNGQVASLTNEKTTLQTNLINTQSQLNSANAQVTSLTSQNATLQTNLLSMQSQLSSTQSQLSEIQDKYPPKPFPNKTALQSWVNSNMSLISIAAMTSSGWSEVVNVQNKALADGWVVSACVSITSTGVYYGLQALVDIDTVYAISIGTNVGNLVEYPVY